VAELDESFGPEDQQLDPREDFIRDARRDRLDPRADFASGAKRDRLDPREDFASGAKRQAELGLNYGRQNRIGEIEEAIATRREKPFPGKETRKGIFAGHTSNVRSFKETASVLSGGKLFKEDLELSAGRLSVAGAGDPAPGFWNEAKFNIGRGVPELGLMLGTQLTGAGLGVGVARLIGAGAKASLGTVSTFRNAGLFVSVGGRTYGGRYNDLIRGGATKENAIAGAVLSTFYAFGLERAFGPERTYGRAIDSVLARKAASKLAFKPLGNERGLLKAKSILFPKKGGLLRTLIQTPFEEVFLEEIPTLAADAFFDIKFTGSTDVTLEDYKETGVSTFFITMPSALFGGVLTQVARDHDSEVRRLLGNPPSEEARLRSFATENDPSPDMATETEQLTSLRGALHTVMVNSGMEEATTNTILDTMVNIAINATSMSQTLKPQDLFNTFTAVFAEGDLNQGELRAVAERAHQSNDSSILFNYLTDKLPNFREMVYDIGQLAKAQGMVADNMGLAKEVAGIVPRYSGDVDQDNETLSRVLNLAMGKAQGLTVSDTGITLLGPDFMRNLPEPVFALLATLRSGVVNIAATGEEALGKTGVARLMSFRVHDDGSVSLEPIEEEAAKRLRQTRIPVEGEIGSETMLANEIARRALTLEHKSNAESVDDFRRSIESRARQLGQILTDREVSQEAREAEKAAKATETRAKKSRARFEKAFDAMQKLEAKQVESESDEALRDTYDLNDQQIALLKQIATGKRPTADLQLSILKAVAEEIIKQEDVVTRGEPLPYGDKELPSYVRRGDLTPRQQSILLDILIETTAISDDPQLLELIDSMIDTIARGEQVEKDIVDAILNSQALAGIDVTTDQAAEVSRGEREVVERFIEAGILDEAARQIEGPEQDARSGETIDQATAQAAAERRRVEKEDREQRITRAALGYGSIRSAMSEADPAERAKQDALADMAVEKEQREREAAERRRRDITGTDLGGVQGEALLEEEARGPEKLITGSYSPDSRTAFFYQGADPVSVLHEWLHHIISSDLVPPAHMDILTRAFGVEGKWTSHAQERLVDSFLKYLIDGTVVVADEENAESIIAAYDKIAAIAITTLNKDEVLTNMPRETKAVLDHLFGNIPTEEADQFLADALQSAMKMAFVSVPEPDVETLYPEPPTTETNKDGIKQAKQTVAPRVAAEKFPLPNIREQTETRTEEQLATEAEEARQAEVERSTRSIIRSTSLLEQRDTEITRRRKMVAEYAHNVTGLRTIMATKAEGDGLNLLNTAMKTVFRISDVNTQQIERLVGAIERSLGLSSEQMQRVKAYADRMTILSERFQGRDKQVPNDKYAGLKSTMTDLTDAQVARNQLTSALVANDLSDEEVEAETARVSAEYNTPITYLGVQEPLGVNEFRDEELESNFTTINDQSVEDAFIALRERFKDEAPVPEKRGDALFQEKPVAEADAIAAQRSPDENRRELFKMRISKIKKVNPFTMAERFNEAVERVGDRVIRNAGGHDLQRILRYYEKKYNLPRIKLLAAPGLTKHNGGLFAAARKGDRYRIAFDPETTRSKSRRFMAGGLRHEIEHVIEASRGNDDLANSYNWVAGEREVMKTGDISSLLVKTGERNNQFYKFFETDYIHRSQITEAVQDARPVNAEAVAEYGIELSDGWVREGDLFIPTADERTEAIQREIAIDGALFQEKPVLETRTPADRMHKKFKSPKNILDSGYILTDGRTVDLKRRSVGSGAIDHAPAARSVGTTVVHMLGTYGAIKLSPGWLVKQRGSVIKLITGAYIRIPSRNLSIEQRASLFEFIRALRGHPEYRKASIEIEIGPVGSATQFRSFEPDERIESVLGYIDKGDALPGSGLMAFHEDSNIIDAAKRAMVAKMTAKEIGKLVENYRDAADQVRLRTSLRDRTERIDGPSFVVRWSPPGPVRDMLPLTHRFYPGWDVGFPANPEAGGKQAGLFITLAPDQILVKSDKKWKASLIASQLPSSPLDKIRTTDYRAELLAGMVFPKNSPEYQDLIDAFGEENVILDTDNNIDILATKFLDDITRAPGALPPSSSLLETRSPAGALYAEQDRSERKQRLDDNLLIKDKSKRMKALRQTLVAVSGPGDKDERHKRARASVGGELKNQTEKKLIDAIKRARPFGLNQGDLLNDVAISKYGRPIDQITDEAKIADVTRIVRYANHRVSSSPSLNIPEEEARISEEIAKRLDLDDKSMATQSAAVGGYENRSRLGNFVSHTMQKAKQWRISRGARSIMRNVTGMHYILDYIADGDLDHPIVKEIWSRWGEAQDNYTIARTRSQKWYSSAVERYGGMPNMASQENVTDKVQMPVTEIVAIYMITRGKIDSDLTERLFRSNPKLSTIIDSDGKQVTSIEQFTEIIKGAERYVKSNKDAQSFVNLGDAYFKYIIGRINTYRQDVLKIEDDVGKIENYFPLILEGGMFVTEDSMSFLQDVVPITQDPTLSSESRFKPRGTESTKTIRLDALGTFTAYMNQADVYLGKADKIAEMMNIVRNPAFTAAMKQKYGDSDLLETLQTLILREQYATGRIKPLGEGEIVARKIRTITQAAILIGNIPSISRQSLSLFNAMGELPTTGSIAQAVKTWTTGLMMAVGVGSKRVLTADFNNPKLLLEGFEPWELAKKHNAPFTISLPDPEFEDIQQQRLQTGLIGSTNVGRTLARLAIGPQRIMDQITKSAAWYAAFNAELKIQQEEGKNGAQAEKLAARFANDVVMKTQPSSLVSERNMLQTGHEWLRALVPFTSQLMKNFQLFRSDIAAPMRRGFARGGFVGAMRELNTVRGRSKPIQKLVLGFVLPPIALGVIARGRPPETWKEYLDDVMGYNMMMVPVIGPLIAAAIFYDSFRNRGDATPMYLDLVNSLSKSLKAFTKTIEGEPGAGDALVDTLLYTSRFAGLPTFIGRDLRDIVSGYYSNLGADLGGVIWRRAIWQQARDEAKKLGLK
jgi:hypothetical protein